ncbi:MAG TPA: feruloyl-CoA synthase [Xanthobacteraceae bacterium]|nr:feruloyl-CoA synthase [Xanthobacteraceae bacterium]
MHAPSPPPAAPIRAIAYAEPRVLREARPDGAIVLRAAAPLAPYDPSLARLFRAAVEAAPDRVFLAERRDTGDWRRLSYAQARRQVDALAQALLERGLDAERPVMVLSGNSIEHALIMLAGYTSGIPVAPISVAYSLQSQDHAKLKAIASLLKPGLVYVADTAAYAKALAALDLTNTEIVAGRNGANLERVTSFEALAATRPGAAVEKARAAIRPDTIAKFLFTSGSTGHPKAVVNTHGMLTANQQQAAQIWPFLAEQPLVLVDWLPWNHTFGGNHNFNMVLRHAGTLYIDGGRPLPALVDTTIRNLSEVSPTVYFNVPAGYAMLLPRLEQDERFARSFFAGLRFIFYAGAALPQDVWTRLEAVAARVTGERVPLTSSWGTTETAPLATAAHFLIDRAGPIGVPAPGVEIKLVPSGAKLEIRVRGPNVTPGYWKRPDLTAAAFDAEGFYQPGDAVRLADPADPDKGVLFDGRLAEDFKLLSGTWVHVGALRVALLAAASPALQDALIAGADRADIAILCWLNAAGCQKLIGQNVPDDAAPMTLPELAKHPTVRAHVARALTAWNATHPGSSERIARALLLPDLPSIDANEITDKGYINQRLALERRAADVMRLYAATPDADVIVV